MRATACVVFRGVEGGALGLGHGVQFDGVAWPRSAIVYVTPMGSWKHIGTILRTESRLPDPLGPESQYGVLAVQRHGVHLLQGVGARMSTLGLSPS